MKRLSGWNAGAKGEPESSQKLCAYLMETALNQMPSDGETVLGIFDFEGAGTQNIDLEFAKFLVSHFPESKSSLIPATWFMKMESL